MHILAGSVGRRVVFAFVFPLWIGCGPKLEEETAKYEARAAALGKYMQRYPAFREHLAASVTEARAVRRLARQVSDPEKKAELLARANRRIQSELSLELDRIEPTTREIVRTIRTLQSMRLSASDRERATNQSREARLSIRGTMKDLSKAEAGDIRTALRSTRQANRKLTDALEELQALQRILETHIQ